MRERLAAHRKEQLKRRITPAYAGKTLKQNTIKTLSKDHPRVCGKDFSLMHLRASCVGSPPRMRERLIELKNNEDILGITPAYAGKTHFGTFSDIFF